MEQQERRKRGSVALETILQGNSPPSCQTHRTIIKTHTLPPSLPFLSPVHYIYFPYIIALICITKASAGRKTPNAGVMDVQRGITWHRSTLRCTVNKRQRLGPRRRLMLLSKCRFFLLLLLSLLSRPLLDVKCFIRRWQQSGS